MFTISVCYSIPDSICYLCSPRPFLRRSRFSSHVRLHSHSTSHDWLAQLDTIHVLLSFARQRFVQNARRDEVLGRHVAATFMWMLYVSMCVYLPLFLRKDYNLILMEFS